MIDFQALKASLTFSDVASRLGLELKQSGNQLRGECTACKGDKRSLVITEGKGAYCFASHTGGDQLWLTAHIRDCSVKDAAEWLVGDKPATVPESDSGHKEPEKLTPLSYLQHDHPAVVAIGFNPEDAKALGIGFAPKGLMRGTVAVPIRLADGTLSGYIGIEAATLPPSWRLK